MISIAVGRVEGQVVEGIWNLLVPYAVVVIGTTLSVLAGVYAISHLATAKCLLQRQRQRGMLNGLRGYEVVSISLLVLCVTACYSALAFRTFLFPGNIDPVESLIIWATRAAIYGDNVYERVNTYGPACFLPFVLASKIWGFRLFSFKLAVLLANIALIVLTLWVLSRRLKGLSYFYASACAMAAYILAENYVFQIRGDVFLDLAVLVTIAASLLRRQSVSILVFALGAACALDIKVTAVLYLIYPALLFIKRWGRSAFVVVCFWCGILTATPFLLKAFPFSRYSHWVGEMSREPRSPREFTGLLLVSAILLAPAMVIWASVLVDPSKRRDLWVRGEARAWIGLLCGLITVDILASKFGGGRHHLVPFVPVLAFAVSELYVCSLGSGQSSIRRSAVHIAIWTGIASLLATFAVGEALATVQILSRQKYGAEELSLEISSLIMNNPGYNVQLASGAGEQRLHFSYPALYAATPLLFSGEPYTYDQSAEADRELLNLPLLREQRNALKQCATTIWIVPRGQEPFLTESIYTTMYPILYPGHNLYDGDLLNEFKKNYVFKHSTARLDVYGCRTK